MSNSNPSTDEDNRDAVVLVANGQQRPIDLRALSGPTYFEQARAYCVACTQITVTDWQNVVRTPAETSQVFLRLMYPSSITWCFQVRGNPTLFSDPLEALLNTSIDSTDQTVIGQATNFALALAAHVCPAAATEAGSRIRQWLSNNGVNGESGRSLAAQIRRMSSAATPNERLTPQGAALMVLAQLQAEREERGERNPDSPPVRFYQDDFYDWNGSQWKLSRQFEHRVVRILQRGQESTGLTNNFVRSVLMNLKGLTLLDTGVLRPPYCITDGNEPQVQECQALGTENGFLDLQAVLTSDQPATLHPPNPSLFAVPYLHYPHDCTAPCPLWLQTLAEILPPMSPDDHRIAVVQEYFGYCLLATNHRFEKFLILIGEGSNGKSVVLEVLSEMLGRHNVSHVSLDAFGGEFRNAEMIGKLANIATDMQRMPRVHEGILKQLVSGEPIQINRKHQAPVSMYPTAKLVFATNHLPPFADTSDGLWRRMMVVPFNVRFAAERIDRYRARRIVAEELPGVLNWALEGARRLIRNDAFTHCCVCESAKGWHRHDSDPFLQFLDECCDVREGLTVLADDLYSAYRGFCDHSGRMPKARPEFGKQLAKIAGVSRVRTSSVRRYYVYHGIGLLPTVMGTAAQDYRTTQYRPPRHQETYPGANRHGRPAVESSTAASPDASGLAHRGMNPETT